MTLAEEKTKGFKKIRNYSNKTMNFFKEMQNLEQRMKENRKIDTVEKKRLDTIDTFVQSKFLKKVTYMSLITEVNNSILIKNSIIKQARGRQS